MFSKVQMSLYKCIAQHKVNSNQKYLSTSKPINITLLIKIVHLFAAMIPITKSPEFTVHLLNT